MKYNTLSLRPDVTRKKWEVLLRKDSEDRVDIKTFPHPLGHYHFPETESVKVAFNKLKKRMIQEHNKEIRKLQKSIEKLKELKLPEE